MASVLARDTPSGKRHLGSPGRRGKEAVPIGSIAKPVLPGTVRGAGGYKNPSRIQNSSGTRHSTRNGPGTPSRREKEIAPMRNVTKSVLPGRPVHSAVTVTNLSRICPGHAIRRKTARSAEPARKRIHAHAQCRKVDVAGLRVPCKFRRRDGFGQQPSNAPDYLARKRSRVHTQCLKIDVAKPSGPAGGCCKTIEPPVLARTRRPTESGLIAEPARKRIRIGQCCKADVVYPSGVFGDC